jgi:CheY-like chemotaxis protein
MLASILTWRSLQVLQAANGQEALDMLHHLPPPSLILLDIQMPIMDGWQFLHHKAEDSDLASIPVVVLTGEPIEPAPVPLLRKPLRSEKLEPFLRLYCGIES